jgi:hypothetical protein
LAAEHDIRPLLVNLSQQRPIYVCETGKPVALPRIEVKDLMSELLQSRDEGSVFRPNAPTGVAILELHERH